MIQFAEESNGINSHHGASTINELFDRIRLLDEYDVVIANDFVGVDVQSRRTGLPHAEQRMRQWKWASCLILDDESDWCRCEFGNVPQILNDLWVATIEGNDPIKPIWSKCNWSADQTLGKNFKSQRRGFIHCPTEDRLNVLQSYS